MGVELRRPNPQKPGAPEPGRSSFSRNSKAGPKGSKRNSPLSTEAVPPTAGGQSPGVAAKLKTVANIVQSLLGVLAKYYLEGVYDLHRRDEVHDAGWKDGKTEPKKKKECLEVNTPVSI